MLNNLLISDLIFWLNLLTFGFFQGFLTGTVVDGTFYQYIIGCKIIFKIFLVKRYVDDFLGFG